MEQFGLGNIIENRFNTPRKRIDYEFQALGLEMQEWFPPKDRPRLWSIFYKKGFTESLIRQAFLECQKRKVKNISYLIAIVNNKLK